MRIVITDCDHPDVEIEGRAAAAEGVDLRLERCRTEDDVVARCTDADGLLVQYAPISARVLDALPRLRVVSRYGVGVDTVDVEAAGRRGVLVVRHPRIVVTPHAGWYSEESVTVLKETCIRNVLDALHGRGVPYTVGPPRT